MFLICIPQMFTNIKHLFICLFANCNYFCNIQFYGFCVFSNLIVFAVSCQSFLFMLDVCFVNVFYRPVNYRFMHLRVFYRSVIFYFWWDLRYQYFILWVTVSVPSLRTFCLVLDRQDFPQCVSSKTIVVLHFTLKPVIHFELFM